MPFAETPEAQEYLQKLQAGRITLPADANELEAELFKEMQERGANMRQITTSIGDMEKQVEAIKARLEQLRQERDMVSGELTGYAKMLVAAEGWRRARENPAEPPAGDDMPPAEPPAGDDMPPAEPPAGGDTPPAEPPAGGDTPPAEPPVDEPPVDDQSKPLSLVEAP